MKTILVTGATGNVGKAVLAELSLRGEEVTILAGVRNPEGEDSLKSLSGVKPIPFDFADEDIMQRAIEQSDVIFLLRPPQLTDVGKYFAPFVRIAKACLVKHIVFLSVQGVTTSSFIPHHKIERLIRDSNIPHTMLRPAYFMQNFTSALREDIVHNNLIFLPAGRAKFTLIDLIDVGKVAALVLSQPEAHVNKAYALTNDEQLTFQQMATILSNELGRKINFRSPGLITFFWKKRQAGLTTGVILVMIMLHFLPRFRQTPPTTSWVAKISVTPPRSFVEFVAANQKLLSS